MHPFADKNPFAERDEPDAPANIASSDAFPNDATSDASVKSPESRRAEWRAVIVGNGLLWLTVPPLAWGISHALLAGREAFMSYAFVAISANFALFHPMGRYPRFARLSTGRQIVHLMLVASFFGLAPGLLGACGISLAADAFGFWGVCCGALITGLACSFLAYLCKLACDEWAV